MRTLKEDFNVPLGEVDRVWIRRLAFLISIPFLTFLVIFITLSKAIRDTYRIIKILFKEIW
jgi:dolichyl-phosphate-mannose--protein O-mannosyl transferase